MLALVLAAVVVVALPFLILGCRHGNVHCIVEQFIHTTHLLAAAFNVCRSYASGNSGTLLRRDGSQTLTSK